MRKKNQTNNKKQVLRQSRTLLHLHAARGLGGIQKGTGPRKGSQLGRNLGSEGIGALAATWLFFLPFFFSPPFFSFIFFFFSFLKKNKVKTAGGFHVLPPAAGGVGGHDQPQLLLFLLEGHSPLGKPYTCGAMPGLEPPCPDAPPPPQQAPSQGGRR